ncbi:MAG: hypothetical protein IJ862_05915 [Selenomonadaceae bacterium]|nr:hypothetical protein [Selenomonadaceae bacterium]
MEAIKPLLLDFLQPDDFFDNILVIESVDYLPQLRERYPKAGIFAVVKDEDTVDKFAGLDVEFHVIDYREERLPFEEEFFDTIIGDLTLEVVINPQDIAAGFSTYLKQTGVWITSFRNIRHWSVIDKLMRGRFGGIVSRLYAKVEFERLCYASFYKEVRMMPVVKTAPKGLIDKLVECGFENINNDLETEFWLIRASRSMPELSLLKSMYTLEQRQKLSIILHRIEYGIETEASVKKFWHLYDKIGLFPDYTAAFIRSVVIHRERFYKTLIAKSNDRSEIEEILSAAEEVNEMEPALVAGGVFR